MAVLKHFEGISVTIHCNGEAIEEYVDDDAEHAKSKEKNGFIQRRTVSKYIKSIDGAHFAIKASLAPPYEIDCSKIGFECFVDGQKVWIMHAARPRLRESNHKWTESCDSYRAIMVGKKRVWEKREFRFSSITTVDDTPEAAAVKRQADRMKKVGCIEVRVYREMYGKSNGDMGVDSAEGFLKKNTSVSEKALKGDSKSHGTKLDRAVKTKGVKRWVSKKRDGEKSPLGIFKFYYRSEEALKKLRLIERTPTPEPSPSPSPERDADGLTVDERKEFEEQKRIHEAELMAEILAKAALARKIKSEPTEDDGEQPRKKQKYRGPKIEIDLTGDDADEGGGLFVAQ